MLGLQLGADFDFVVVVDLPVDVGDLLGRHVVRRDYLTKQAHGDLPLDVAEADMVLGANADLK